MVEKDVESKKIVSDKLNAGYFQGKPAVTGPIIRTAAKHPATIATKRVAERHKAAFTYSKKAT